MTPLTRTGLLELWERGRGLHPLDRALLLLGAAYPDVPFNRLADVSVGQRDAALLELRCATFGAQLEGYTDCPGCGERLEFSLDGRNLQLQPPALEPAAGAIRTRTGLRFRLPSSRDLALAAGGSDPDPVRLLEICYEPADGAEAPPPVWTDELLAEVEERFAAADPQGDIELDFACQACGCDWRSPFDIGGFLWEEIEARAIRLVGEVHVLARAYGWAEREILEMSEARRSLYLELVSG